ncbi:MAG: AAA family ATPase [Bacillota bacterium]
MPTRNDSVDRLMEQGRIRGESRMIPEGTESQFVTAEQSEAVKTAVLAYLGQADIRRTAVAKDLGIANTTLGLVLNGKYNGNWQQIILDLDRWLEERQKRDAVPKVNTFVWTNVALEIRDVAEIASRLKTIGLVYGPKTSGIGKTMALKAIAAEKPGSIYVTVEKAASNASGLMRAVAHALRIGEDGSHQQLYRRIKGILAGSARLLIVDQIHNLCCSRDDRPLFILTDLHDATEAPQLWCGTVDVVNYLRRGQERGRETLAQIRRRIGIRRDLMQRTQSSGSGGRGEPLFTVEEIRKIFGRNKMRLAIDAAQYLTRLANLEDSGALGTCHYLVRATTLAHEATDPVLTAAMLRSMQQSLVDSASCRVLEARLEDEVLPLAKVG